MSFERRGPRSDRGGGNNRRGGGRSYEPDESQYQGQYEEYRAPVEPPRMLGSGEGDVKWYNVSKGFGFIAQPEGEDVYVHRTALQRSGVDQLNEGDKVAYNLVEYRGRIQADSVTIVSHAEPSGGGNRDRGGDRGGYGGGDRGGDRGGSRGGDRGGDRGAAPALIDDAVHRGAVKFYNSEKGFGFIQPDDGAEDVFFHISGMLCREPALQSGETVVFRMANHRGRINAVDVDRG
jgi:cold shock protein